MPFPVWAQTTDITMNETLKTIHKRKSVRTFSEKEVSKAEIEALMKAAMCAPSSKNNQPWSFYIIRNKDVMQKLANALPYAKMLPKASAVIIVCGDSTKGVSEPDQAFNWALDCSAASQNLLLAAESIGLGATWTGVFPYKKRIRAVRDVLQLPENVIPLNAIPIGYPAGNEKPKDKFKPESVNWID
jgi:nitroreductase